MAAVALTPFLDDHGLPPDGIVVTAVLPGGCPLNCPFCIVAQRGERSLETGLTPHHLPRLLQTLAARGHLGGAAIVGDEPLQESAWPYARPFLERAQGLGVPVAIITNGQHLADYVPELSVFDGVKLIVSLDGVGARHDAIRRTPGAFAAAARGIAAAVKVPALRERLTVGVILLPNNVESVHEVIAFASEQGIANIALSPLLDACPSKPLRVHPKVMDESRARLPGLKRMAETLGVHLHLTDEFASLGPWCDILRAAGIETVTPRRKPHLIRIDAMGRVETYDTVRMGTTTGIRLPAALHQIDDVADDIVGQVHHSLPLAS